MNSNFTNNLLRLVYLETNTLETLQLVERIENDDEVKDEFSKLSEIKNELNKLQFDPSDDSIEFILKYSRKRNLIVS